MASGEKDKVNGQEKEFPTKKSHKFDLGRKTDRAHGSFRPLAASLCCVNSSGVPSAFHCRQSGMDILLWPWSPPILETDICKLLMVFNAIYSLKLLRNTSFCVSHFILEDLRYICD